MFDAVHATNVKNIVIPKCKGAGKMFDAVHATNVKNIVRWAGLLVIEEFSVW